MAITYLNQENFESKVLKAEGKVLVDVFATWCGPCKMIGPVLEKLSEELTDTKICKMDIDQNQDFAMANGIMSVPTLLVYEGGKIVNKAVGALDKAGILNLLGK
ncbi:MAG: thioredoxin [Bacilli bacterium]